MENGLKKFNVTYSYFTVIGIFLIVICRSFLSDGMFMDGTMYATISRNLANGLGTFWTPHFTDTFFPVFNQHPPLAFGLESIFFRLIGDIWLVERLYSILTIAITGLIIVSIWKSLGNNTNTGWIPLLFWIAMPTITWSSVNNMLENTMGVFICLSVLFYIRSFTLNKLIYIPLSGLALSFGFLTKGIVSFFPLTFPFFIWLCQRNTRFIRMISDTLLMLISSLTVLMLLYLLTDAKNFFPEYLSVAFGMITNEVTKDSRFYILYRLLMELLPALIILLLFLAFVWKSKSPMGLISKNLRPSMAFLFLGLAGVLPIMISRKQSSYYLMTSLAFFAVSFGLLVTPHITALIDRVTGSITCSRFYKYFGITVLSAGIILNASYSGGINRDHNMLRDIKLIIPELKKNSIVNILPEMNTNYILHAYFARLHNISLDADITNSHNYLITGKAMYSDTIYKGYNLVNLQTREYDLFRRKRSDSK